MPADRTERYAFTFVSDLLDEGLERTLERFAADGFTAVAPAVLYHHGRDILPHHPRRVVQFHDGGASHVVVPPPRGPGLRVPSTAIARTRPIARIIQGAHGIGLGVFAWIVLNHNTRLGTRYPSAATRNAFGDPIVHALCPASPRVRELAERIIRAVAREGVDGLIVEAVGYGELDHGFHHERSVVPTSPAARYLLGVCLCRWCAATATAGGVDVPALRRGIVGSVRDELDGGAPIGPLRREVVERVAGGSLGRLLETRQSAVTELVAGLAAAAQVEGLQRVTILDPAGAILGYETGQPDPNESAVDLGWRTGIDVASIATSGAAVGALGYVADAARLGDELAAYRARIGSDARLDVVLRPMTPDGVGPDDLRQHVDVAMSARASGIGMYHYGLAPRSAWSAVRAAFAG